MINRKAFVALMGLLPVVFILGCPTPGGPTPSGFPLAPELLRRSRSSGPRRQARFVMTMALEMYGTNETVLVASFTTTGIRAKVSPTV